MPKCQNSANAIVFTLDGPVMGWQRAGKGRDGHHFTQKATREAEDMVGWRAQQAAAGRFYLDAVAMVVELRIAVPSAWSKARRAQALSGQVRPVCKPDVDNVCKALLDGLTGCIWRDDTQVSELTLRRIYAESAGATVTVWRLATAEAVAPQSVRPVRVGPA